MLLLDGALAPAHTVQPGSRIHLGLAPTSAEAQHAATNASVAITRVERHVGGVVNPITSTLTMLVGGPEGPPALAATYGEWATPWVTATADLGPFFGALGPMPLARIIATLAPQAAQAYHDRVLEPLFPPSEKSLRPPLAALVRATPAALRSIALPAADLIIGGGFALYAAAAAARHVGTALAAAAAVLALRRRSKRRRRCSLS